MPLLSATLLVCEKMLQEVDGVLSAIRLGDLFILEQADAAVQRAARFWIVAIVKFHPDDIGQHVGVLRLIRPNGEATDLKTVEPQLGELEVRFPGTPRGFNVLADMTLSAQQMGTHYLTLTIDGQEVARTAFTLIERPVATSVAE